MSVSRNNAPAVSYPSGVFAFCRPLNLALWGITAMLGAWVWSHSNATLSQVAWLLLLLAWLVIGLMVAFIPNRFKVGDLQWSFFFWLILAPQLLLLLLHDLCR